MIIVSFSYPPESGNFFPLTISVHDESSQVSQMSRRAADEVSKYFYLFLLRLPEDGDVSSELYK